MSLFENQICPVCKRQFEDGDDIVVCPDCGTPHHRECYGLIGHCVNRGLHKSNYNYTNDHPRADKKEEPEKKQNPFFANGKEQENAQNTAAPPFFGAQQGGAGIPFFVNPYESDSDTIDGESVADVAAVVRSNAPRFINVFKRQEKTGKKSGWNWGAFVFGHYYFFFRKMYRQAIIFFCIMLTLSCLCSMLTARLAPETIKAVGELQSLNTTDPSVFFSNLYSITEVKDYHTFLTVNYIFAAVAIIIRILFAVFADSMYKSTVTQLIKRVNEKLDEGAAFGTSSLSPDKEAFNSLNQNQMRRLYLAKKGGVSFWAALAAYFAMEIILTVFGG